MSKNKSFPFFQVFSWLLFFVCLIISLVFLRENLNLDLNSDDASEMILGKLLADEGIIITKNWYYNTELRIIHTNIVYAFFFKIFHSWHHVRLFSIAFMYFLLLVSYYWMCSVYKIKKYFALSATVLILPFSYDYYEYVLHVGCYLPYLHYTLLILTFSELFLAVSGKKQYFILLISFLFSIVLGLAGGRELVFLFGPILIASIYLILVRNRLSDAKKYLIYAFIIFLGSIIGIIINSTVLAANYHFMQWNTINFTEFSVTQFVSVISSLLYLFGYEKGPLSVSSVFHNFICMSWLILTLCSIIYSFKNNQSVNPGFVRLSTVYTAMYAIFLVFCCFTDFPLLNRYMISIIILSFPCIALYFDHVHWNEILKKAIYFGVVLLTVVSGMLYYGKMWNFDSKDELRSISKDLVDKGYNNGYATYWNANILTELSYGKIEAWSICSNFRDLLEITSIDSTYKWNQKVTHDTTHPEGKVFLLFTRYEFWNNNWKNDLPDENIINNSTSYIVYGFDSYEQLTGYINRN